MVEGLDNDPPQPILKQGRVERKALLAAAHEDDASPSRMVERLRANGYLKAAKK